MIGTMGRASVWRAATMGAALLSLGVGGCTTTLRLMPEEVAETAPVAAPDSQPVLAAEPVLETAPALPKPAPKRLRPADAARVLPAGLALGPAGAGGAEQLFAGAEDYARYTRIAAKLTTAPLKSTKAIRAAAKQLVEVPFDADARGWVIYSAGIVLNAPGFKPALEAAAAAEGRAALLARIAADPAVVRGLPGTRPALDLLTLTIAGDVATLKGLGTHFRQTWTRLQARAAVADVTAAQCRRLAVSRPAPRVVPVAILPPNLGAGHAVAIQDQILALAARMALGAVEDAPALAHLSANETVGQCLRFAKLNLKQCLAAGANVAETAYCAGRHGADEVADCLGWIVDPSVTR